MEGTSSAIDDKSEEDKEARNEAGTSTSGQKDSGDNVCPEENNGLLESSKEDTVDGASGAVVEEDEENKEVAPGGGVEVVEDGEDEELSEDEDPESPTMDTYLEDMLDTMAESVTTLADTVHTLQNTTGAEPRVELRCQKLKEQLTTCNSDVITQCTSLEIHITII